MDTGTEAQRSGDPARARLLAGLPVAERRYELAGIPTSVLEGGAGPPLVLLHGPGEFAAKWLRVIPQLVTTHRVIAPDLPLHGASEVGDGRLDTERVLRWLDALLERTCDQAPVLLGHVIGGAIAARYASRTDRSLARLVLVDSLGLGSFRPAPRFLLSMLGFQAHPTERSYDRFMRQCSLDLDALRDGMGERWEDFVAYNLASATSPKAKQIGRLMREVGFPRIPEVELARIETPTTLIWGSHDRANRPAIAEAASARFGWPLHVIEDCADDPPRDRPEAFLEVLHGILDRQ
jgi:pimeloyl-ACP methyl ester carboxylesterase